MFGHALGAIGERELIYLFIFYLLESKSVLNIQNNEGNNLFLLCKSGYLNES